MNPKITRVLTFTLVVTLTIVITNYFYPQEARESLTYFPFDPSLTFLTAETNLSLQKEKEKEEYTVEWETISETDKKVYLRQDVSMLFRGGFLVDSMYEWKEDSAILKQTKYSKGEDSTLFQAISLHHAENHLQDKSIKSAQIMTSKKLYIIDSSFSPLESFQDPINKEQSEWKKIVDHVISENQKISYDQLIKHFKINRENYYELTLLNLVRYNTKPLPGMDQEQSQKVLGQLWEGIYKNYLLGIKLSQNEAISPLGSKIPIILLSKDLTHLYILIEGKNREKIKLLQQI